MFKDLPDGQTHCYTQEEEMRMAFEAWWNSAFGRTIFKNFAEDKWDSDCWTAWQAALASQAEQVRKLELEVAANKLLAKMRPRPYADTDAGLVLQVTEANEAIAALQARIESNKQEPRYYRCMWPHSGGDNYPEGFDELLIDRADPESEKDYQVALKNGFEIEALFTRPPVTSERELALLEVIEQKDKALAELTDICITQVGKDYNDVIHAAFLQGKEALTLTPESALKEDRARVLEDAADSIDAEYLTGGEIMIQLRNMAAEMRKP